MQVPRRKAGEFTFMKPDPLVTAAKLLELKANLKKLKEVVQPELAQEVKRLALMGDFSENAAYGIAKGRLRGINQKILDLQKQIDCAEIIEIDDASPVIKIGTLITVKVNQETKTYRILGSLETNPGSGVISYNSPIGQALLGKKVGEIVEVRLPDKTVSYQIIKIE